MEVEKVFVQQLSIWRTYLGTLQEFKDLIAFVVVKSMEPHVGLVLPLTQADEGFRKMPKGNTAGKVVVSSYCLIAPRISSFCSSQCFYVLHRRKRLF